MTPADVVAMAKMVVKKLQVERANGITTPLKPKPGHDIVDEYNRRFHTEVREKDFWEIVWHIRAEMGLPLGSNDHGYFWCISETEWDATAARLRSRIAKQQRAIDRPTLAFQKARQTEMAFDSTTAENSPQPAAAP